MNWTKQLTVGDVVSYSDVNLWPAKGRLVRFERGQHGGDCIVAWDRSGRQCEECASNLIAWRAEL